MHQHHSLAFKYKGHTLIVPEESFFIPYAPFIAGEYAFLDISGDDAVINAEAKIWDFTLKASMKAKLVIAVEPNFSSLHYSEKKPGTFRMPS